MQRCRGPVSHLPGGVQRPEGPPVSAHFLRRVHLAVVQPGEDVPAVPHGDHGQGPRVEGRGDFPLPADLLRERERI